MSTIVEKAKEYLGTPYIWGGNSPDDGGMDCSGFVIKALNDAGYKVGDTTAQGLRTQGTSVSKDDMQPGDILFFGKNSSNASHVGIYVGNGQMIHSSGGSANTAGNPGKGVEIRSVRADLLEVRRMGEPDGEGSSSVSAKGIKGLMTNIVQFLSVLIIAVLAVVFFMLAFDLKVR